MNKPILRRQVQMQLQSNGFSFGGQWFEPDDHRAYVRFKLCNSWPQRALNQVTFHPDVLRISAHSMLHQVLNINHQMKAYDPDNIRRDRNVGSVVAVAVTPDGWPEGFWDDEYATPISSSTYSGAKGGLSSKPEDAIALHCVGVIHKNAEGVPKLLGEHMSGRKKWTVSVENNYDFNQSGWIISNEAMRKVGLSGSSHTPESISKLDYSYFPTDGAPEVLSKCWSKNQVNSRAIGKLAGEDFCLLVGGLDTPVSFLGVGLTPIGKEPGAEILSMAASAGAADVALAHTASLVHLAQKL